MSAEPRRRFAPEVRRAQLLEVAERVFARHGYQGTTVEDIAAAAGVTRPLIYKYFADKDAVYLECLRRARVELDDALSAAAGHVEGAEARLRAGFHAYFTFVRDRGSTWDVLFGGGAAIAGPVAEEAAELRYQTAELIAVLVRDAAPSIAADAASTYAHALSGAAEQTAKWWRRHPEVDEDTVVGRLMETIWTGLERTSQPDA